MSDIQELVKALLENRVSVVPEYSRDYQEEDRVIRFRIIVIPPRTIGGE